MFEDIYALFKVEMDGEEFDSDDDALLAANTAMRTILADRDWIFLEKSYTLPTGTFSLASLTDLDKLIRVWYDEEELVKAEYKDRFNTEKDYYFDTATSLIVPINEGLDTSEMIADYKFIPTAITATTDTNLSAKVISLINPLIAYLMGMSYYRKDQDLTIYNQLQEKYEQGFNKLIDAFSNE